MCGSSAQTTPDDQVDDFEIVENFDDTPSAGTARSRPWSIQGRSIQSVTTATSLRILDECGTINIPRSHLAPIDPHDVPDACLLTQVRWWLLLRNTRLGHKKVQQPCQERRHKLQQSVRETEITVERCRSGPARPALQSQEPRRQPQES